jgi:hypothetical protein
MAENANVLIDSIFNIYSLVIFIVITIIGIFLGFKQKITIFRDFNDLGLVFLIELLPIVLMYLSSLIAANQNKIVITSIIIVEIILFMWIIARTYQDNNNILSTLIALITKTSLSILFILNLMSFSNPTEKTEEKRASVGRFLLALLLLLSSLLIVLVKNKEGIFNLYRTLSRNEIVQIFLNKWDARYINQESRVK